MYFFFINVNIQNRNFVNARPAILSACTAWRACEFGTNNFQPLKGAFFCLTAVSDHKKREEPFPILPVNYLRLL